MSSCPGLTPPPCDGASLTNSRLIDANEKGVRFKYKDYRIEGPGRYKTMTLEPGEFIRRFMLHVLPKGFHRIRHYGLLARSRTKAETLAHARELIAAATPARPVQPAKKQQTDDSAARAEKLAHPCPRCGARMVIIETFKAGRTPRHRPTLMPVAIRIDTS